MRQKSLFKQSDVTKLAKALTKAGYKLKSVQIGRDYLIATATDYETPPQDDLDSWLKKHARQA
jgi:hypothetical protein